MFIYPLILVNREYCEIIKYFDTKDGLFSSLVLENDKKEKDIISSSELDFPSLRSKISFSEILAEFSNLDYETKVWLISILMITKQSLELMIIFQVCLSKKISKVEITKTNQAKEKS